MIDPGDFAAVAMTLYVAHNVGDYWVQTDHQARHKGMAGWAGRIACYWHVATYTLTQWVFLALLIALTPIEWTWGLNAGLWLSAVTHYMADRREHGAMFWLARRIPGKAAFLKLGAPRDREPLDLLRADGATSVFLIREDNPQLATGAWALDQAWHIFFGVFLAALLAVSF